VRGGEGGFSLPSAMFLKSVKKGWCWGGGGEDQLQKQLEQNVDRKSENIYTSTQRKKLTHVNLFANVSKNHVKFKYQSCCFLPGNFYFQQTKDKKF
jgi:hypothetical protein